MKAKSFYLLLSAVLLSTTLLSCSDDDNELYIVEAYPYSINILVQAPQGNDLIASGKADGVKFEYSGDIYEVNTTHEQSRAAAVNFHGLRRLTTDSGESFFSFGEFRGEKNVTDELIIIHWSDGTSDEVAFSNYCDIKEKEINIERTIKFNGKAVECTHSLAPHSGKAFIITK